MKNLWLKTGVVATTTAWSLAALAATSSSTTTVSPKAATAKSVVGSAAVAPEKKDFPISVSTLSFLYGPLVKDPGNSATTDDAIDAVTGISTRHQISFKYALNKKTSITPVLDFDYQLTDPSTGGLAERQFRWRDSFVKLSRSSLINATLRGGHQLGLDGDVRFFVPSSERSRDNSTIGGLRMSLMPSLQFKKSRFSLSALNFARYWLQTNDKDKAGVALPRAQLYTGPQINYQASDRVTAFVLYEAIVTYNTAGVADTTSPMASLADVEPGVELKIHDRVSLTPYLNWYTNQRLETTTLNLAAAITLL